MRKAAGFYFFRYGFAVTFEIGVMPWGSRRVDIVANKVNGSIVVVEIKSGLSDFRADKKWQTYLPYCDKFLFMMTEALFKKVGHELPKEIGVLCLCPRTGYAYIAKRCPILTQITPENRISTLARLAWRSGELSKRTQRARTRVYIGKVNPSPIDDLRSPGRKRKRLSKKAQRSRARYQKELKALIL